MVMRTRPLKYDMHTRNTAFTIPLDVIDELEKLCKQHKILSRSELITKLIHQAYLQYNDPVLSVQKMKERKREIEEQQKELEQDCIGMYGRTLEEHEKHLLELELQKQEEEQRIHMEEQRIQELQRERALLIKEKRPAIQATLTEFFLENHPNSKKPFSSAFREKQLIDVWRFMDISLRGRIIDRARTDAGWHRDNWGKWERTNPPPSSEIPGYQ